MCSPEQEKWYFRISELASSVLLLLLLLATMRWLYVYCSVYVLRCFIWASLCQVHGAEYLRHKYFVDFHICLYLDLCCSMCGLLHVWYYLVGIEIFLFFVLVLFWVRISGILNIFLTPQWFWSRFLVSMGCEDLLILFIEWSLSIVLSDRWLASQDFYLVCRT